MRNFWSHRLVGLAAIALLLTAPACNSIGDDPDGPEAVIEVTEITPITGLSLGEDLNVVATVSLLVEDRNGSSASPFNDVTFTSYSVTFSPSGLVSDIAATSTSSVVIPIGGSGSLDLFLVSETGRPVAGTLVSGQVRLVGHDNLGRAVSVDFTVQLPFTT